LLVDSSVYAAGTVDIIWLGLNNRCICHNWKFWFKLI
jgi:hypothetical protein